MKALEKAKEPRQSSAGQRSHSSKPAGGAGQLRGGPRRRRRDRALAEHATCSDEATCMHGPASSRVFRMPRVHAYSHAAEQIAEETEREAAGSSCGSGRCCGLLEVGRDGQWAVAAGAEDAVKRYRSETEQPGSSWRQNAHRGEAGLRRVSCQSDR